MKKCVRYIVIFLCMVSIGLLCCIQRNGIEKKAIINSKETIAETVSDTSIYDVILFWGQSNMVGYCGSRANERNYADTRYTYTNQDSVNSFSQETGIDSIYLSNSVKENYVKVSQVDNTVYEYSYLNNSLVEMDENTNYVGDYLLYNKSTGKLVQATTSSYSIMKSYRNQHDSSIL